MEERPADSGQTQSTGVKMAAPEQRAALTDSSALTGDQVLEFLHDLRLDRRRSSNLNSGRNLLLEAAEAGLVDPGELDAFIAQMVELHRADLVGWTYARHDVQGDELPHAAEFHVTERGRRRLAVTDGRPGVDPSLDHRSVLAGGAVSS